MQVILTRIMPARNVIKTYVEGGYYHLYNRGVEKREIFVDEQDYRVFLKYLRQALDPEFEEDVIRKDLSEKIELIAYCLMPTHFHLLVKQKSTDGIAHLIQSVSTRYSMYFNHRYDRIGSLFQGPYKAALVETDEQLMHVSRYIHLNPRSYKRYPFSSYIEFTGKKPVAWVYPGDVLALFSSAGAYADFVEGSRSESKRELGKLVIS